MGVDKNEGTQNGWFIMENPIKWMIWGYPYFWKHPYDLSLFFRKLCNTVLKVSESLRIHVFISPGKPGFISW